MPRRLAICILIVSDDKTQRIEEQEACFTVRDENGQTLAYVYFEEEPGRRAAAHLLTRARRGASPPTLLSCRSC